MTAPETIRTLDSSTEIYKQPKTQADTRTNLTTKDQHGRAWAFQVEKETMDPCSEFNRVAWPLHSDPLDTPGKYIKMVKDEFGQKSLSRVIVDFHQWVKDTKEGMNDWNDQILTIGQEKFGGSMRVEDLFKDPRVLTWAGSKPWPSVEALTLAAQGDKELLGFVPMTAHGFALLNTKVNLDLNRFHGENAQEESIKELDLNAPSVPQDGAVPEVAELEVEDLPIDLDAPLDVTGLSYPEFLKDGYAKGMALPEIAAGWQAHKQNLNTE